MRFTAAGPARPGPASPPSAVPIGTANPIPANASSSGRRSTRRRRRRSPGHSGADRRSCPGSRRRRTGSARKRAHLVPGPAVQTGNDAGRRAGPQPQWVADGHHIRATADARRGSPGPRPRELSSQGGDVDLGVRGVDRGCCFMNRMETLPPPRTTWLAVSTVPVSVTITPDPSEAFEVVISTTDGTTCRYGSR